MTENVRPLFAPDQPGPTAEDIGPTFLEMARTISAICASRILGLIAVIGAVAMFGYAVIQPEPWRLYSAISYAAFVLFPIVLLYLRKG